VRILRNHLFAQQRPAQAFDQVQAGANLIGAVDGDGGALVLGEGNQRNAQFGSASFGSARGGNPANSFELSGPNRLRQRDQEFFGRRPGAQADEHIVLDEAQRRFSREFFGVHGSEG